MRKVKKQLKKYKHPKEKSLQMICLSLKVKETIEKQEPELFFLHTPNFPDTLTKPQNISNADVNYYDFNPANIDMLNFRNIHDCFQRIINFIYQSSGNKFNKNELQIHFQFANLDNYKSYLTVDIMNIFNYSKE